MHAENENSNANPDRFDAGCWLGRTQAVAAMASQCSFAQAECLRKLKESNAHQALGLTWEEFCSQHVGVSRARADIIIQNAREFGESYFRLAEIVAISPQTYRQINPAVDGETVDLGDGKVLALVPENAPAIRAAIAHLRKRRAPSGDFEKDAAYRSIRRRLKSLFADVELLLPQLNSAYDAQEVRVIVKYCRERIGPFQHCLRGIGFMQ